MGRGDVIIIERWRDLPDSLTGASVAMGNFDGVHLGHAHVIDHARQSAEALGAPLGVVTFEPHPRRFLNPTGAPFALSSQAQRGEAFSALGVQRLYQIPFTADLAAMSAQAFVRDVLHLGLKVRSVSVGFDFNFGQGRSGSAASLKSDAEALGIAVSIADPVVGLTDAKCSSSAIRRAVHEGRPEEAAAMLGRPFAIRGEVVHGEKIGRTIGFPTANIQFGDYVRPAEGIYAAKATLPDGRRFDAAAYVGRRPTINGLDERLEVNLFDFDEDLYGQELDIQFIAFLRGDMKFDSLEALKGQIGSDCAEARRVLTQGS